MEREVMDLQDGQEETCLKCEVKEGTFKGIIVKGEPPSSLQEVRCQKSLSDHLLTGSSFIRGRHTLVQLVGVVL